MAAKFDELMSSYCRGNSTFCFRNSSLTGEVQRNVKKLGMFENGMSLWAVCWLVTLEYCLLWCESKPLPPVHENLVSIAHAIFNYLGSLVFRSSEFAAYVSLWHYSWFSNWFDDSLSSVLLTVILIDFGYYWFHRMSHEVMVFWAVHQVHHSSMDLTFPVGLRHSPFQRLFSWIAYLPLALLGIPPSHAIWHIHVNYLYQIALHTCSVGKLGFLEYIFNTPSHHRVHHGSNKSCLDVNYGGILIVWDFLFGTMRFESDDEEIVYGIISHPATWNIFTHQIFYLKLAVKKAVMMDNWIDFFHAFWKGPSWQPGSSRIARELPIPPDQVAYRPRVNSSVWIIAYVATHLMSFIAVASRFKEIDSTQHFIQVSWIVLSLVNFGLLFDGNTKLFTRTEALRCIIGLVINQFSSILIGWQGNFFLVLNITSCMFCLKPFWFGNKPIFSDSKYCNSKDD